MIFCFANVENFKTYPFCPIATFEVFLKMQFYNLHTHIYSNSPSVLELVNQYPWEFDDSVPYYSIGIHPWYIDENRLENDLKIMEEKLVLENCLAVGECGLDKRIDILLSLQIKVFEYQILLAEKYKKPLVLHLVAAYDELISIKNRLKITVPIIIHGFSKNENVAKQLLNNGFYLSFGKHLLHNPKMEVVFHSVPNDRFFLETDNLDIKLTTIYEKAAQYKKLPLEEVRKQVETNWKKVF